MTEEQKLINRICDLADSASEELGSFPSPSAEVLIGLRKEAEAIFDELAYMAEAAVEEESTCSSCDGLGEDPRTDVSCSACNGQGGWPWEGER
tara:strand:+ start:63 stop:341 length:279 start_codon:yes stop_codon:yes gene_type:complete